MAMFSLHIRLLFYFYEYINIYKRRMNIYLHILHLKLDWHIS